MHAVSHLFHNEHCISVPLHPEYCHGDVLVTIMSVCNTFRITLFDRLEPWSLYWCEVKCLCCIWPECRVVTDWDNVFFNMLQTNYCNQICQKLHWPTHKKFCKALGGKVVVACWYSGRLKSGKLNWALVCKYLEINLEKKKNLKQTWLSVFWKKIKNTQAIKENAF